MEKTLRQIQEYNLAEKTRQGENPEANPERQPCKENKAGRKTIKQIKGDNPEEKQGGIEPTPERGRQPSVFRL